MAEINTTGLEALSTRRQTDLESHPALPPKDYAAAPSLMQKRANALNAYNFEGMIGKYDPEKITMKQRAQMRRDPMLALGLNARKNMIINAKWRIECEDPQVAAFVERCLRQIHARLFPQMLLALEFAYIPIVKRFQRQAPDWQYEDPESGTLKPVWPTKSVPAVTWNAFQALPPEGAQVKFGEDGKVFAGFEHALLRVSETSTEPLRVPPSHALWITNEFDEGFGDYYGYPLTGYAFRYWWSYWYQWLLADRHMEQDADPPLRVDYPPGTSLDADGNVVDNHELALQAGADLRDGATVAVPSEFYEVDATGQLARGARKWDMEFITGGENIKAFHDSFQYLDVMKLRSLMVPDQALIGAKGSLSGNVAETYGAAFEESQSLLMQKLIVQPINDYMIPDLVAQNFVDPPECKMVTEGFRGEDRSVANELLQVAAANDPSALGVKWTEVASSFKLPVKSAEEIAKDREQKFEEAQRMADIERPPLPSGGTTGTGKNTQQRKNVSDARGE